MDALNRGYYITSALAIVGLLRRDEVAALQRRATRTPGGCTSSAASSASSPRSPSSSSRSTTPSTGTGRSARSPRRPRPARRPTSSPASRSASSARALPVIAISIAILASYKIGSWRPCRGGGLFGTAVATMGMLGTAAYILAMDTFGPITDNAGGIVEMSQAAGGDPQEDRPPRRRRQHDQGADQGLRHRLGGAGGVPALLRLPRRAQELRRGADVGQPRQARGLRRRAARRDARLLLLGARDQGRRQGRLRRHPGRAAPVQGAPGSCRAPRSRTTAARVDIVTRGRAAAR